MSANIPEHVTKDQRIANQLFKAAVLELEIIDLAKKRADEYAIKVKTEFNPDMWHYDHRIEKKIDEMNDLTRKAIGPPPPPVIKAKQKYYMLDEIKRYK